MMMLELDGRAGGRGSPRVLDDLWNKIEFS